MASNAIQTNFRVVVMRRSQYVGCFEEAAKKDLGQFMLRAVGVIRWFVHQRRGA
jgi:hypothetical protein